MDSILPICCTDLIQNRNGYYLIKLTLILHCFERILLWFTGLGQRNTNILAWFHQPTYLFSPDRNWLRLHLIECYRDVRTENEVGTDVPVLLVQATGSGCTSTATRTRTTTGSTPTRRTFSRAAGAKRTARSCKRLATTTRRSGPSTGLCIWSRAASVPLRATFSAPLKTRLVIASSVQCLFCAAACNENVKVRGQTPETNMDAY